jgi:hypothetical protein
MAVVPDPVARTRKVRRVLADETERRVTDALAADEVVAHAEAFE